MHSLPHRAEDSGFMSNMLTFNTWKPLLCAARISDGRDVVIRVLAIGEDGRKHVEILQMVTAGPYSLHNMNHALPLMTTLVFDDITFGVFPKAGGSLRDIYGSWAAASVGDVLNVIGQCLEGLSYLHTIDVAHHDAYKDDFLMQWCPETLVLNHIPPGRARVYIIGFEHAVQFPEDMPPEQRFSTGPPVPCNKHDRSMPPEVLSGKPYRPFKLDGWQLGFSFRNFRTTIPAIDNILASIVHPDPAVRPSAYHALCYLQSAVSIFPPVNLRFPPTVRDPDEEALETESSVDTKLSTVPYAVQTEADQVNP